MTARGVAADSKVREVMTRYPATGGVFLQTGALFVAVPGQLYVQYPDETVEQYARRHGVDLEGLLRRLQAAAESTDVPPAGAGSARPRHWAPEGPIGYTGRYVETAPGDVESESFARRQSGRGPY